MQGLRAWWRRPTAGVLTYGGEVVAAHRLGDGWARRRRTGEAEVGDDEAAQRVDPLGAVLREAGRRSSRRGSPPGDARGGRRRRTGRGSSPPGGARGGRRRRTGLGRPPGGGRGHDAAAVSGSRGGGAELSGRWCGALGRGGAELGTTAARRIDGAEG